MEENPAKFEDKLHETLPKQINKVIEQQNTYADAINKNSTKVDVLNHVPEVNDLKTIMIEARKEEQALQKETKMRSFKFTMKVLTNAKRMIKHSSLLA